MKYIHRRQFYIKGVLWQDIRYDAKKRLQSIYLKKGLTTNIDYPNLLNDIFID